MSSVLQERGFEADQIRTVLNNRATADAIRERLHWLLDDALPGDERVLFYSGHGAQLPAYSASEVVDHVDECLVPWDFDWSPERAIIDDEFCRLYTQLSYDVRFVSIFDCCHSGGIARGSMLRARGIDPPDDIRHRLMQWNADLQVWQSREIHPAAMEAKLAPKEFSRTNGQSGNLYRLGRAARIRGRGDKMLKKLATKRGHDGPYMPLILEACQEGESAYEYRDGVTSYGAFTFSLAKVLRSHFADQPVPFSTLLQNSLTMISDQNGFGYPQHPQLEGPTVWKNSPIPFGLEAPERKHASPPVRAAKRSRTRK